MTLQRSSTLTGVVLVLLSGCTMVGRGGSPPPDGAAVVEREVLEAGAVRRVYGGSVTFSGDRIALTLEFVDASGEVSARLSIPSLELDAGGAGEIMGDEISLELAYGGECPGRLTLYGSFREERRRLEGRLTARDCTGEESGAVVMLIRPGGTGGR